MLHCLPPTLSTCIFCNRHDRYIEAEYRLFDPISVQPDLRIPRGMKPDISCDNYFMLHGPGLNTVRAWLGSSPYLNTCSFDGLAYDTL